MTPHAKGQYFSGGIDFGLIKMLTNVEDEETGVFITHQSVNHDVRENVKRIYLKYHDEFIYEINYTKAIYSDYICTGNNFLPPLKGKECSGGDFIANQLNVSVGKKINLYKNISLEPSLGVGFVHFEDVSVGFQEDGTGSGGYTKWHYSSNDTYFRVNNLNLNLNLNILYDVTQILSFKLFYNFQQAAFKIYTNEISAWNPDNVDIFQKPEDESRLAYAKSYSYGSNTQFGLGIEYKFGKKK